MPERRTAFEKRIERRSTSGLFRSDVQAFVVHDPSATTFHVQTGVHSASHRQMHRRRGFDELPGGNWYGTSKTDGRCLELVYRRWKSLSVRRVISGNPFCALLSRFESVARSSSNGGGGGLENGKSRRQPQLFNRAPDKSACTTLVSSRPPPPPPSLSSCTRASILSSVAPFRHCFFLLGASRCFLALSQQRWSRVCAIDWHGNSISLAEPTVNYVSKYRAGVDCARFKRRGHPRNTECRYWLTCLDWS